MGYRKRTGFLAGLTVAQISEFSIVFVAMGITLGHVGADTLGLTTLVGLVTIMLSTYMILYSQPLYRRLEPLLGLFERKRPYREMGGEPEDHTLGQPRVLVIGLGRYGARLMLQLKAAHVPVLGVDFDPETVRQLLRHHLPVCYGDGEDASFFESLPLGCTQWVVTSLPDWDSNRALLHALEQAGYRGQIAAMVRDEHHGHALRAAGVTQVFNPFTDAADFAARRFVEEFAEAPPPASCEDAPVAPER
jgi:hypothetical protein